MRRQNAEHAYVGKAIAMQWQNLNFKRFHI